MGNVSTRCAAGITRQPMLSFDSALRRSRARHIGLERYRDGANVLHIADLMDDEVYRRGDPQRRAWSIWAEPAPCCIRGASQGCVLLG